MHNTTFNLLNTIDMKNHILAYCMHQFFTNLKWSLIISLITNSFILNAQWNNNAGVIYPYSTTILPTLGTNSSNIIDDNDQTFWQSNAPLPSGFFNRNDLNLLKGLGSGSSVQYSAGANIAAGTDGNLDTQCNLNTVSGKAWISYSFATAPTLRTLSLKAGITQPLYIYAYRATGDSVLIGTYSLADSYNIRRFSPMQNNIVRIKMYSNASFMLFEAGAMSKLPTEYVTLDLGMIKRVGWIETRHFNATGGAVNAKIYVSGNNSSWVQVATLNTSAIPMLPTLISPPRNVRYVKIEFSLPETDWAKASLWEAKVYNEYGPYGPMPAAEPSTKTLAQLLGVNGIWGWGTNVYSYSIPEGQGPTLYNSVSKHARNYHELNWDINDPDNTPDYTNMANGNGTQAQWWLNWDDEYGEWNDANMTVQTSIQFTNASHPVSVWNNPYNAAYNYGYQFARHFGPTYGNGMVECMEVGNEPWDYPAAFYRTILRGMARGARDADPAIDVLPCALQAGAPSAENSYFMNYTGARLSALEAPYLSGLNVHYYSFVNDQNGTRIATYPENLLSGMRAILNDIRFRNTNMPGKKICVSEWGWDAAGGGQDCTHSECVTEQAQALYGIRGALMYMRLGVDRLTWFFYGNLSAPSSLFTRSGLTGPAETGYMKKKSFKAFREILNHIGNYRFLSVKQESNQGWVYEFGNATGNRYLVAWRPVDANIATSSYVSIASPNYKPVGAWRIQGNTEGFGNSITLPSYSNGNINMFVGAAPIIIRLAPVSGKTDTPQGPLGENSEPIEWKSYIGESGDLIINYKIEEPAYITVELFDIMGRKIEQKERDCSEPGIEEFVRDMQDLPAGTYIIRSTVAYKEEESAVKPFVLTRKVSWLCK